jgi:pyridoxal phosphate enzyme (YggS family)
MAMGWDMSIAANLDKIRTRIADAAHAAGRKADEIKLIAVSKTHDAAAIAEAIASGQRVFGENRVQEAQAKFPGLKAAHPDIELHLIGQLQSNKAREAVMLADAIHGVDRASLAKALAGEIEKQGRAPKLFIQVNTGEEPQKGGVLPGDAEAFLAECRALGLSISGIMCIPPESENPSLHFALLAGLAKRLGLAELSMGMSGDYDVAVKLGATYVRVGSAIFGARG